ncbi:hypothetical protein Pmani_000187 [Petrolisthes manimaculis]|uniref:Uncharacterized protein n=1 Tax=Petrolisthes manimaculis TaxID=1843537 RepID=A0AAE1QNB3_9EUCA|nr:hypothetical protein Pmani_000187 [Petrolisthes manimaculis]
MIGYTTTTIITPITPTTGPPPLTHTQLQPPTLPPQPTPPHPPQQQPQVPQTHQHQYHQHIQTHTQPPIPTAHHQYPSPTPLFNITPPLTQSHLTLQQLSSFAQYVQTFNHNMDTFGTPHPQHHQQSTIPALQLPYQTP